MIKVAGVILWHSLTTVIFYLCGSNIGRLFLLKKQLWHKVERQVIGVRTCEISFSKLKENFLQAAGNDETHEDTFPFVLLPPQLKMVVHSVRLTNH